MENKFNPSIWGAIQDPGFWNSVKEHAQNPGGLVEGLREFGRIPGKADAIAEEQFPGQARDSSQKNAFRHALGTGMIAQHMGAGEGGIQSQVAKVLAKGAGYGWEALGAAGWGDAAQRTDTLHDLNANAIGGQVAVNAKTQQDLINALKGYATNARQGPPPGVFEQLPMMTYTKN